MPRQPENHHGAYRKPEAGATEYVTSLILQRPTQMIQVKRIAVLILLRRGWVGKYKHLRVPRRFNAWHDAYDHRGFVHPFFIPNRILTSLPQMLDCWRRCGIVKKVDVSGCDIGARYVLTPDGEDLLRKIAPEIMAEARALVRATLWQVVLHARCHRSASKMMANIKAHAGASA